MSKWKTIEMTDKGEVVSSEIEDKRNTNLIESLEAEVKRLQRILDGYEAHNNAKNIKLEYRIRDLEKTVRDRDSELLVQKETFKKQLAAQKSKTAEALKQLGEILSEKHNRKDLQERDEKISILEDKLNKVLIALNETEDKYSLLMSIDKDSRYRKQRDKLEKTERSVSKLRKEVLYFNGLEARARKAGYGKDFLRKLQELMRR
jgi:hypothetical protein